MGDINVLEGCPSGGGGGSTFGDWFLIGNVKIEEFNWTVANPAVGSINYVASETARLHTLINFYAQYGVGNDSTVDGEMIVIPNQPSQNLFLGGNPIMNLKHATGRPNFVSFVAQSQQIQQTYDVIPLSNIVWDCSYTFWDMINTTIANINDVYWVEIWGQLETVGS